MYFLWYKFVSKKNLIIFDILIYLSAINYYLQLNYKKTFKYKSKNMFLKNSTKLQFYIFLFNIIKICYDLLRIWNFNIMQKQVLIKQNIHELFISILLKTKKGTNTKIVVQSFLFDYNTKAFKYKLLFFDYQFPAKF
ncbi:hypothetical protein EDEG_02141 [Edhazardia aedis USNM 41457]|uniref:Transmembrane protein n=1 Tax=Edhazardia aedis (strain USNM 41457) TaxID=1003232 RepID=J9DQH7_EDHAE|nr:hypothetical protein EDEG_02141 [Edhazardia aedis USNM 41457]|eukprot:EJW03557.1 hypothetical protein EDEG_02141 [Edhazardia aedis USNM 41457]